MKLIKRTLALLPMLIICGCSTTQSTSNVHREIIEPEVSRTAQVPVGGLPAIPRIVVDEQPLAFSGFGLTREERAQLENDRSQRINSRIDRRLGKFSLGDMANDKQMQLACVAMLPLCPVALPVMALVGFPLAYGTMWVGNQTIGRVVTSNQEPSLISERDGSRLAATLRESATGASLRQRALHLAESSARPAAGGGDIPILVIRIKAAQLHSSNKDFAFTITAQAQALIDPSTGWSPTEHVYSSSFRPLASWTLDNDALVRHEIDQALDALASRIRETYLPHTPRPAIRR